MIGVSRFYGTQRTYSLATRSELIDLKFSILSSFNLEFFHSVESVVERPPSQPFHWVITVLEVVQVVRRTEIQIQLEFSYPYIDKAYFIAMSLSNDGVRKNEAIRFFRAFDMQSIFTQEKSCLIFNRNQIRQMRTDF